MNRQSFPTRGTCLSAVLCAAILASACGGGGGGGIVIVVPDVFLTVTASPTSVQESGANVGYTIMVLNSSAENVTIDSLTDSLYDLGVECPDAVGTVLVPAEDYSCVFVAFVSGDPASSPVVNTVSLTFSGSSGSGDTITDSASVTLIENLDPQFTPDDATPGPMTISMQDGAVTDSEFDVEIHVTDIADFFGAAFHVTFDPGSVDFLGHDETGSILSGMNPLFFAAEVAGNPGEIAVEASLQGSGAGLANGDGLLITLRFAATANATGNDFTFEPVASRLVKACPTANEACNEIEGDLSWPGGSLDVN